MWVLRAIIRSWSASAGPEHMFGYVLPVRSRLTEQEWADYRAAYCGLCHTMKRRYGFLAQFLLNYDFTFLALLLRRSPQQPCVTCRRCLSAPIRGRMADTEDASLDAAADGSVLLVYWKLRDQLADERGLKKLAAAGMLGLFHGVFRRENNAVRSCTGRSANALQRSVRWSRSTLLRRPYSGSVRPLL